MKNTQKEALIQKMMKLAGQLEITPEALLEEFKPETIAKVLQVSKKQIAEISREKNIYTWKAGNETIIYSPDDNLALVSCPHTGKFDKIYKIEHMEIVEEQFQTKTPVKGKEASKAKKELDKWR